MKSIFTLSTSPASRISTHQMSSHRKTIFPPSWKTIHKRFQISLSVPMDTIYERVLGALPRGCLFQKILAKLCVHTSGTQYANGLQSAYPMQSTSCLPFNSFSFKNGKLHFWPRTPGGIQIQNECASWRNWCHWNLEVTGNESKNGERVLVRVATWYTMLSYHAFHHVLSSPALNRKRT